MEVSYLYGTACMKNKSLTSHLIFFKFEYHTLKRCKGKAFFITQQAILYIFMQSGEGNGNPLQYSCLENPMDGGAWQATVHGVSKSQTRLSDFTFTFMHWRRRWQPTPVFLPGESQGRESLVGCRLWGRTESDTTEATQQQQQLSSFIG